MSIDAFTLFYRCGSDALACGRTIRQYIDSQRCVMARGFQFANLALARRCDAQFSCYASCVCYAVLAFSPRVVQLQSYMGGFVIVSIPDVTLGGLVVFTVLLSTNIISRYDSLSFFYAALSDSDLIVLCCAFLQMTVGVTRTRNFMFEG